MPKVPVITVEKSPFRVELKQGGLVARWDKPAMPIAHLGCKLLSTLKKDIRAVPGLLEHYDKTLDKRWKRPMNATRRVAGALAAGLRETGLTGATLIDTMRKGSDYWRPGNLLRRAAEAAREEHGFDVNFLREDDICPPLDLLDRYLKDEAMTFAAYEAGYVEHLAAGDRLLKAAAACVQCLSTGRLPVFYCVDPHVPDYDRFGHEPSLRKAGCHRFTLAAALNQWLSRRGVKPAVVELDPTFESARIRPAP